MWRRIVILFHLELYDTLCSGRYPSCTKEKMRCHSSVTLATRTVNQKICILRNIVRGLNETDD